MCNYEEVIILFLAKHGEQFIERIMTSFPSDSVRRITEILTDMVDLGDLIQVGQKYRLSDQGYGKVPPEKSTKW